MPRRSLWLILGAIVISLACYQRADRNPYGRWFSEVLDTVDRFYVEPVDEQELFEGALEGMVGKLDPNSAFLSRDRAGRFQETIDQQFGGIGIEVSLEGENKQLTVMATLVGTPAYKAGIRAGDKIVAINGESTGNRPLPEIVRKLRGPAGDPVSLSVLRAGRDEPLVFDMVRARIKVDSVLGDTRQSDGSWSFFLPGEDKLGYVRINSFGEPTVDELEQALDTLSEQGCRGLILDLRNNPGGLLPAAEKICNLFLPARALIVSTRGRDRQVRDEFRAVGDGKYQHLPLVVLVNENSASASEIVAACLQDHHRAIVVGQRSYGKGTVQNLIPLEGGRSLLKLTIASYWRPSGKNIHRLESSKETDEWGVKPDAGYDLPLDEKQLAALMEKRRMRDLSHAGGTAAATGSPVEFDTQLQRAVEALKSELATEPAAKPAA